MPELPEVETVCRGLKPLVQGQQITKVVARRKDLRIPLPPDMAKKLTGKTIQSVKRRAKYILLVLDTHQVLLMHLGMSGRVMVQPSPYTHQKHDHVVLYLANGTELVFNDPRRFGLITLTTEEALPTHSLLVHLGVEPLTAAFDGKALYAMTRNKKVAIKQLLMNAALVVGVGNIYASESLFTAGVSPLRQAGKLTLKEAGTLAKAIKDVLSAAIKSGGSTLRDFVGSNGESGYFQHHFSVYGKAGQPCEHCGHQIKQIKQSGRSTFFCPKCQK